MCSTFTTLSTVLVQSVIDTSLGVQRPRALSRENVVHCARQGAPTASYLSNAAEDASLECLFAMRPVYRCPSASVDFYMLQ